MYRFSLLFLDRVLADLICGAKLSKSDFSDEDSPSDSVAETSMSGMLEHGVIGLSSTLWLFSSDDEYGREFEDRTKIDQLAKDSLRC